MTKIVFQKPSGESYFGDSLDLINDKAFLKKYKGKINLIFTSPPFSLISKKIEIKGSIKNNHIHTKQW